MEETFDITRRPPSSQDALDILVNARIEAEQMLNQAHVPEHNSGREVHADLNSGGREENEASFEDRLMKMMEGFSQRLDQLASKVDSTDGAMGSGTPTGVPPSPTPSSASASRTGAFAWAERSLDESLDLRTIHWPDDKESETPGNLVEVSAETKSFLELCFGRPLGNPARQRLRKTVDVPKVDAMKCPKLDCVVKGASQRTLKTQTRL